MAGHEPAASRDQHRLAHPALFLPVTAPGQNNLMVSALLFDVFGTVVDWRNGVIRDVTALTGAHGTEVDAAAFADAWRGATARHGPGPAR